MRTQLQVSRVLGPCIRNRSRRIIENEGQRFGHPLPLPLQHSGISTMTVETVTTTTSTTTTATTRSLLGTGRPFSTPLLHAQSNSWSCLQRTKTYTFRRGFTTESAERDPYMKYSEGSDERISPQEYKLRVGKAIRTLQNELPQFFQQGLCTTSVYASNVRFIEASHTNASVQGKPIYFILAGAVRWSFKMWFRDLQFEIQSIRVNDRGDRGLRGFNSGSDFGGMSTSAKSRFSELDSPHVLKFLENKPLRIQEGKGPTTVGALGNTDRRIAGANEDQFPPSTTVTIRWTLKGTTRPSVVLTSAGPSSPPPSSFSGVFVYKFNERGLIDEHKIENIMPSPSPEAIQRAFAWWGWILGRARPAAAAAIDDSEARKRLGLGYFTNK